MSGVPNTPGSPLLTRYGGHIRLGTWNARALFHQSDVQRRAAKVGLVRQYLPQLDVLFIQEAHGTWEDIWAEFADFDHLSIRRCHHFDSQSTRLS